MKYGLSSVVFGVFVGLSAGSLGARGTAIFGNEDYCGANKGLLEEGYLEDDCRELSRDYIELLEINDSLKSSNKYFEIGIRKLVDELSSFSISALAVSALASFGVVYERKKIREKSYEEGFKAGRLFSDD